MSPRADHLARELIDLARRRGVLVATAESCTGGLVGGAITAIPGSSDAFDRGFVTYSNAAKTEVLGVPAAVIAAHGAVSEPVVRAMAEGALAASAAGLAVAVTGVAGPGGTAAKPEGLVWFAASVPGRTLAMERRFGPVGRDEVRAQSVEAALALALQALAERGP